jgi:uncharacterized RDD family membrane protein YckC
VAGPRLADWLPRAGAGLIDLLLLMIPAVLAAAGAPVVVASAALLVAFLGNLALMARQGPRNGMTIGKQVVGIRVVREDGERVTVGFALLRDFVCEVLIIGGIGGLLVVGPLVNVLWPLWDERNQTLHDKMVKSYVVRG